MSIEISLKNGTIPYICNLLIFSSSAKITSTVVEINMIKGISYLTDLICPRSESGCHVIGWFLFLNQLFTLFKNVVADIKTQRTIYIKWMYDRNTAGWQLLSKFSLISPICEILSQLCQLKFGFSISWIWFLMSTVYG